MVKTITAREYGDLCRSGAAPDLLDVRTPAEFGEVHVVGARNVPLDRLDPAAVQASRNGSADQTLYVICRSGSRAKQACEKFIAAGISNVVNIEGGTMACDAAGVPVLRGKKVISLERQVRICAGALALAGSLLGYFVDPRWFGLSAFIGAGLVFAGVTDTCGMAMMLGRMPWNQAPKSAAATQGGGCCSR
jgi:rhodanese-related sulfurtransferase